MLFKGLEEEEFEVVIDAVEEVQAPYGTLIIKEGDQGDCMYIVESGTLDCTKVFKGNTKATFLKEYVPGDSFGELSLLYNTPRAASIKANQDSVLWRIDRATFNHIVKDSAIRRREKFEAFLKSVKVMARMDAYERSKVADALQEEMFQSGEIVI